MAKKLKEKIQCANFSWLLFVRAGVYYADGRSHGNRKHSLDTKDRQQAIKNLVDLDRKIKNKISNVDPAPEITNNGEKDKEIAIADGWKSYLDSRDDPDYAGGLADSSKDKYERMKKRFTEFCERQNIENWNLVDKSFLKKYAKFLDTILSPRTVHHELVMAISVSNYLIFDELIPETCKIRWKLAKPVGSNTYCYRATEVSKMLEYCEADSELEWLRRIIMVLSHSGLRIGEAIELKHNDIDYARGFIHVQDERFGRRFKKFDAHGKSRKRKKRTVKNKQSRVVPIHGDLMTMLKSIRKKSGYVLTTPQGFKVSPNRAREQFIEQVIDQIKEEFWSPDDEIGFKDARFHSFRHFFVSQCFENGIAKTDVRDWIGHRDSKIIELYRHLRQDTAKQNMNQVNFGKFVSTQESGQEKDAD